MPEAVAFATKPRQAVELFTEAEAARVPYGWIAADGGYGQYREVRDWPTERSKRYVMAVPSNQPLARVHGVGQGRSGQAAVARADDLLGRATRWERRSCGHGAKGERFYDWAFYSVTLPDEPPAAGFTHTLMIRRSVTDPGEVAYFLVHAPHATPTNTMVAVAGIRWRIEECNEQGKDLIGHQHQVRTWTALHHHVVVAMFAHAFAATRKARLHTLPTTPRRPADRDRPRSTPGKRPDPEPDPPPTTHDDLWRQLTTVADIVTLLGSGSSQPATRDKLTVIRWTLWKQTHRLRAQISHYQRRGEPLPAHLRIPAPATRSG